MSWPDWVFMGSFWWLCMATWANLVFHKPVTLWKRGRWALIFEPVDCWIGGYHDRDKRRVYLVVVPMFPLRYQRKRPG